MTTIEFSWFKHLSCDKVVSYRAYYGLSMSCKLIEEFVQDDDTVVYLKLFALLYADDTIILAESAYELQAALHGMFHYCNLTQEDQDSCVREQKEYN